MSHEMLTVKLCELDERIGRLHSRIYLSGFAQHDRIRNEIRELRQECEETDLTIRKKLKYSRAEAVSAISGAYDEIGTSIRRAKEELGKTVTGEPGERDPAEEKLLVAEYMLDFALQAADSALLSALEAIDAQMTLEEKEEENTL